jgi:hypothetical protein
VAIQILSVATPAEGIRGRCGAKEALDGAEAHAVGVGDAEERCAPAARGDDLCDTGLTEPISDAPSLSVRPRRRWAGFRGARSFEGPQVSRRFGVRVGS